MANAKVKKKKRALPKAKGAPAVAEDKMVRQLPRPRKDTPLSQEREDARMRLAARNKSGKPHRRFKDAEVYEERNYAEEAGLSAWLDSENPAVWSGNICED